MNAASITVCAAGGRLLCAVAKACASNAPVRDGGHWMVQAHRVSLMPEETTGGHRANGPALTTRGAS